MGEGGQAASDSPAENTAEGGVEQPGLVPYNFSTDGGILGKAISSDSDNDMSWFSAKCKTQ